MDFPIIREFTYKIKIERRKRWDTSLVSFFQKDVILEYKQANIREVLEYNKEKDKFGFWMDFLINKGGIKNKKAFNIMKKFHQIEDNLVGSYIFGKIPGEKNRKMLDYGGGSSENPESSILAGMMETMNCSLKELYEYTFEQVQFTGEGRVWRGNETTKEGRDKNKTVWNIYRMNDNKKKKIDDEMDKGWEKFKKTNKFKNGR